VEVKVAVCCIQQGSALVMEHADPVQIWRHKVRSAFWSIKWVLGPPRNCACLHRM